jgi:hypothetical protein
MRKPIISIKLSPRDYAGLVNLGNRIIVSLTGNANYTTPAVTLANLQAAVTSVEDAIALWGAGSNRGSKANLADLRTKALTLSQLIKSESQYVQLTAQLAAGSDYETMNSIIMTSGFDVVSQINPQGILEMVQGFHQFISRQLYRNQVKLKWSRPLNITAAGNVKGYRVMRNTTVNFDTAVQLAITTRTSYVDVNDSTATQTWTYWIVPFNQAGDGVPSDAVTVAVLGV